MSEDHANGNAVKALMKVLQDDPEMAWAWHCNIAMPIMDELNVSHKQANFAAARLMSHLFEVDMQAHPLFVGFGFEDTHHDD